MLSSKAVEENILKARKAFFVSGCLGAFQGQLNPLSGRSIYLTCVLPILLYGCENWIVNDYLLNQLKCFESWVGKRLLGLSKYHSNAIVPIALDLPCVRSLILQRKLKFLVKLMPDDDGVDHSLSRNLFAALAMKDIYNISVVSQCLYLEDELGLSCISRCLERPSEARHILSSCVEDIRDASKHIALERVNSNHHLKHLLTVENNYPWMKLWDWALDYGVKGTMACQLLLKLLTLRPIVQTCGICKSTLGNSTFLDHVLSTKCSKFSVVPFSVADLCHAVGTEHLFTYTRTLQLYF